MKADLHIHTRFSDGGDTPEQALEQAKQNGVELISFVDHDTTETYAYAQALAERCGVRIIPGIEVSAYDFVRKRKVHLIGYNYKFPATNLIALCDPMLKRRTRRGERHIRILRENGYAISKRDVDLTMDSHKVVYKQNIMHVLTDAPFESEEYRALYQKLFKGDGICAASRLTYIAAVDAIRAIKADGGIAVLAHPGETDSFDIVPELIAERLDGIEVYHPSHSEEDMHKAKELADRFGLLITGGSDYHGRNGRQVNIGDYTAEQFTAKVLSRTRR